jgi:uncharacterized LabA/DUF88 family protein
MGSLAPFKSRLGGFFLPENRVVFLVDGFNVYHSAKVAAADLGGASTLWLDLRSLLSSYISLFGRDAVLSDIYYFSALARHIDSKRPGTTKKHQDYMDCLTSTGVKIRLGRFKYKTIWCGGCKRMNVHFEEKETDVALSLTIMKLFHFDSCDTVVLVTGDTDLAPAVRMAAEVFPEKNICFAFPYKRKNKELNAITHKSFLIRKERYAAHQFSDPFKGVAGRTINKPATW